MLSPEVLAEQVMGYVVWASELIPTLNPSSKKSYSVAILPQGPHFYTGLLQAAGYLLLNNQKKNLLILSQQSDDKKNILIDTIDYGPIIGQTWKNSATKINSIVRSIGAKKWLFQQKPLSDQIDFQIPFFRVIIGNEKLLHISIGDNISQIQIKKLWLWIHKHINQYNVVILTNIELSKSMKSKKSEEQDQIAKIIQTKSQSTPLLTTFQQILALQKKKPEIIAYVNPGDFGKTKSLTTRYICAVW